MRIYVRYKVDMLLFSLSILCNAHRVSFFHILHEHRGDALVGRADGDTVVLSEIFVSLGVQVKYNEGDLPVYPNSVPIVTNSPAYPNPYVAH